MPGVADGTVGVVGDAGVVVRPPQPECGTSMAPARTIGAIRLMGNPPLERR
jgi:hypothetical protein